MVSVCLTQILESLASPCQDLVFLLYLTPIKAGCKLCWPARSQISLDSRYLCQLAAKRFSGDVAAQNIGSNRSMQLGEFFAPGFEQQEVMPIDRNRQSKQLMQDHLGGGTGGDIPAADNPVDADGGIIDHHGQLIGDRTIAPAQHGIPHGCLNILGKIESGFIAQISHRLVNSATQGFVA